MRPKYIITFIDIDREFTAINEPIETVCSGKLSGIDYQFDSLEEARERIKVLIAYYPEATYKIYLEIE